MLSFLVLLYTTSYSIDTADYVNIIVAMEIIQEIDCEWALKV